jgi:hypothetical protein
LHSVGETKLTVCRLLCKPLTSDSSALLVLLVCNEGTTSVYCRATAIFGVPADEVKKVNVHLHTPCKFITKVHLYLHQFLTSELDVGEWTHRRPRYLWSTSRPIAMVHYTPTRDCYPLLEYIKLSGDQTGIGRINFDI